MLQFSLEQAEQRGKEPRLTQESLFSGLEEFSEAAEPLCKPAGPEETLQAGCSVLGLGTQGSLSIPINKGLGGAHLETVPKI